MTYLYYKTSSTSHTMKPSKQEIEQWTHMSDKSNWRITQLPNGYYQAEYCSSPCEHGENCEDCKWHDVTRRETIDACETAIDKSIEHYQKKLEFVNGPKVVKTFK